MFPPINSRLWLRSGLASLFLTITASIVAADPGPPASATIIEAASFGLAAEADDNTEALRKALADCAQKPNPRLVLKPGAYRFKTASFGPDKVMALVEGVSNLTIEGGGAQFLLVGDPSKVTGIRFSKCRNVRLVNVSVDCEKLPFAQGKIVSFEEAKKLVIELDPKFPLQDDLPIESIVDCDAVTGLMLGNIDLYHSAIESVQKEAGNRLVVNLKLTVDAANPNRNADLRKLVTILPGEKALVRQATYGSFMFTFVNCQTVDVQDVTVNCFAGMALHAQESSDVTIRHFVIAPPAGSGRLLSVTKDGIHLTHITGLVKMEDCRFDAIGDDAFNVYSKFRTIKSITDASRLEMVFPQPTWRGPTPLPGDTLDFWDTATMDWKGGREVESASWDAAGKVFKVAFRAPLPANLTVNDFVSNEKFVPRLEVRRCTFRGMLARAIVASTQDVLIEDCEIAATSYSGILFPAGMRHGGQGPAVRKVVIRHNVFKGTGGAAIYGYVFSKNPGTSAMSDILITDNQFLDDPVLAARRLKSRRPDWVHWSAAICLRAGSGVRIEGNTFTGYPIALYLEKIENTVVTGNTSKTPTLAILNQVQGAVATDPDKGFAFERDLKKYDADLYYIGILR